jgi:hypothetical protein
MSKKYASLFILLLQIGNFLHAQANWNIVSETTQELKSNMKCRLQETTNEWFLIHQTREYGINLGWGKTEQANVFFEKNASGNIKSGDKLALFIEGGGYIKHEVRKNGIHLVLSNTPSYEWEIRNLDNAKGQNIKSNTSIGLFNTQLNDFLVYCYQKGFSIANIGWISDCKKNFKLPNRFEQDKAFQAYLTKVISFAAPLLLL